MYKESALLARLELIAVGSVLCIKRIFYTFNNLAKAVALSLTEKFYLIVNLFSFITDLVLNICVFEEVVQGRFDVGASIIRLSTGESSSTTSRVAIVWQFSEISIHQIQSTIS